MESSESGSIQFVETKEKLIRSDVSLLAFQYDIRIDCAKETPSQSMKSGTDTFSADNWSHERLKRRRSFTPRTDAYFWQVLSDQINSLLTSTNLIVVADLD
jgi:hypothetical protein